MIAGFLDLVPQFGATIAGFIVVLATLTEGLVPAVVMLAIVLTYQQVENQLLQPVVVGRAARVSGFFVLVSVLVFGALFGVVGVVVAVLLTASIQIVVREVTAPPAGSDGGAAPGDGRPPRRRRRPGTAAAGRGGNEGGSSLAPILPGPSSVGAGNMPS